MRARDIRAFLQLPIGYFDRSSSGALLSRLTYNTEQIGNAATDSVTTLVRESLTIIGSVGVLLYLNSRLALIALILGPLIGWLASIINRYFRRYSRRIQDSMGDVTRVAKEALEAPRVIKVYNAEAYQSAAVRSGQRAQPPLAHAPHPDPRLANPVVQFVTSIGLAFVLSIAISEAVNGRMSPGDLLAFFTALVNIASPARARQRGGPLQQGIAAAQNLFELLDEPAEPQGGGRSAAGAARRGGVRRRHVRLRSRSKGARAATTSRFRG